MAYGEWAVFDAANNEYPMPQPDQATYIRPIVGTDANGTPLRSPTATVTWLFGADPDADGGVLSDAEYDRIVACIQPNATLVIRTKDDSPGGGAFVKVSGKSAEFVPGATKLAGMALGVLITVFDCEAV